MKRNFNINQYTWDLSCLLAKEDDSIIQEKRNKITQENYDFIEKWKDGRDYQSDPEVLNEALCEYENMLRKHGAWGDEAYYFHLRHETAQNDPTIKAKSRNAEEFATKILNDLKFFELNISKISCADQAKFLAFPGLAPYKHFIERLFAESKHLLSEAEEKIISLKAPVSYANWAKLTAGFLTSEERKIQMQDESFEVKSFSEISSLLRNNNKKVRDSAAKCFNEILAKYRDVAEAEINSVLLNKKIDDELRGFDQPYSSRLLSDDIEPKIVETLLSSVSGRFDIPNEFYKLKAQLLGLKKLEYHERNVEYGKISKKIEFKEAINILRKAFSGLDDQFLDIFDSLLKNQSIDAFPAKGKRDGAFCSHNLLSEPTFVLLNYTGTISDVSTFAHEIGHAINNELMRNSQNSLYFGTSLAVAEVASTFMEDFVLQELQNKADDELRLSILVAKLDMDISSIFRQVACINFEKELHYLFREKGYLSKDEIGSLFQKHMSSYMGDYVEQSIGSENWWIHWNHIRSYFYNYSYANGLLISKALQRMVKQDPRDVGKVKKILSAGLSMSPKEIFADVGINLAQEDFWSQGLDEVEELLQQTKFLAKKLGKI